VLGGDAVDRDGELRGQVTAPLAVGGVLPAGHEREEERSQKACARVVAAAPRARPCGAAARSGRLSPPGSSGRHQVTDQTSA